MFSINLNLARSPTEQKGVNLEQAIKEGNSELIASLVAADTINEPMANGELPLHFAVRQGGDEAVIKTLLEAGAQPSIKDYQGETAIDHAILLNRDAIARQLISHQIGATLDQATDSLHAGAAQLSLSALEAKKDILTSLEKTYPQQYAVLQGVPPTAADLQLLTKERLTLLHLAVLKNDVAMVQSLLDNGVNLNAVDNKGNTAAHYAAIHSGDTKVLTALIKAGADPTLLNQKGVSVVGLFGAASHSHDPMKLSHSQALMFFSTVLFYAGQYAMASDPQNGSDYTDLILGSGLVLSLASFAHQFASTEGTWKKAALITLTFSGLSMIPGVDICMQAWQTANIAGAAFAGLKSCWNNIGCRTGRAIRNAVVHTVNTAQTARAMIDISKMCYEKVLNLPYLYKMYSAQTPEESLEAWLEYQTFLNERYLGGVNIKPIVAETIVDPTPFKDMEACQRANQEPLFKGLESKENPNPSGALAIINPNIKWEDFLREGVTPSLKRDYKTGMRACHPDTNKNSGNAAKNIGLAWGVLNKYAEQERLPTQR